MATFRRCNRCHKLYEGRGCPECSKRLAVINAQKRQSENEGRKLYGSYKWAQCREAVRMHYMDFDIWLLAEGQLYKCVKPYIHHIVERDEAPALIYDLDNLIVVCDESHRDIHRYYEMDKAYALERIERGKAKFRELFE